MRNRNDAAPLYGWTFHQSHDQATVLFLVPYAVSPGDLDIRIASDHVSASIPNHPPILHAKLYGRVNTETSTWRIADRDRSRKRRSRSFVRSSQLTTSPSGSGSADVSNTHATQARPHHSQTMESSEIVSSGSHVRVDSSPASHSSLSVSVVSLRSGSSYEVLSHSNPSLQPLNSAGPSTEWSSGSSDRGSSDSADASLNQSIVLSDPGDLSRGNMEAVPPVPSGGSSHLRRSQSISDLAPSAFPAPSKPAGVSEAPQYAPPNGPPEVRLVTVHLDKIDAGIWPLLVVGPAPLQSGALSARSFRLLQADLPRNGYVTESFIQDRILHRRGIRQERQQRNTAQLQLNQALEEALSAFEGGDRVLAAIRSSSDTSSFLADSRAHSEEKARTSMDSDDDYGPNTSTLSINTIGSDESATVLGSRVASLSGTSMGLYHAHDTAANTRRNEAVREEDDDEVLDAWKELEVQARYNMDPTTLSLIGLQFANSYTAQRASSLASQLARSSSSGIPDAFEYFARAWRAADVSLATERLVQDFLPLLPSSPHAAGSQDQSTQQARFTDSLDPTLASTVVALPPTTEVIADPLREVLHSHTYMSHRQRLVASLGGSKALARLYVSYAKLHLPSLASHRSPLAFPYGQLTSPFVNSGHGSIPHSSNLKRVSARKPTSSTSSRTPSIASLSFNGAEGDGASPAKGTRAPNSPTVAEASRMVTLDFAASHGGADPLDFSDFVIHTDHSTASQPPAFYFFREACLLDGDVIAQISPDEWREALTLAAEYEHRRLAEREALAQAEEMGSMAGDSESGELTFESDSEAQRRRAQRRSKLRAAQSLSSSNSGRGGLFNLAWLKDADTPESGRKCSGKTPRRAERNKRRKERTASKSSRAHEEAGVINFVSGAALLGVALAGSVAALGWWRRSSAALNSTA
ncbi:uncharacterized protein UMAG_11853 [Mycosarcoma maydis]|uniref:NudC domain-containing protein 1 n=1 Tax=Mycosarcoma maydis TaxID=5270 RepID=A0A0D1CXP4_MYCMD|nr:uncharacterized protein UMAG_11853 [Ustilago maydis 521]KIS71118.1 hypothetical protein UMAG_11853 [Ustilago maydis 521]|eukprot:XP_011387465.1 hypothetical protein UMAG_11853 [Ustilago maydis 521]